MIFHRKITRSFVITAILLIMTAELNLCFAQLNNDQKKLIAQYTTNIKEFRAKKQFKEAAYYSNKCAFIYVGVGNYEQAIDSYLESVDLNEKIGNDLDNKKIYNNIAMLYAELNQMNNSIKYFEKSLLISRRNNNKNEIAVSLMDISTILLYNKQYEKAIGYLEEALKISYDQDNLNALISCYDLLAKSYKETGNLKKSEDYYQKYLVLDQRRKEGKNFLENKSEDFLAAESNNLNKEKPDTVHENLLLELPENTNFNYRKDFENNRDSISKALNISQEKTSALQREILKIEKEFHEIKLKAAKYAYEKKKSYIYFTIAGIFALVVIIAFVYLLYKKQKHIKKLEEKLSIHEKQMPE